MALRKLYITGVPGQTFVYHPQLAGCEVMLALREGKLLVETTGTPTGKQFKHNSSEGKLELDATIPVMKSTDYDPSGMVDSESPETFYAEFKV